MWRENMKCPHCREKHKKENTGCRNSGNWNSGNWNSGYRNSGNQNSGNWNSGYWNSGNRNTGAFNTDEPDWIRVFNKWLNMKPSEFYSRYNTFADIPLNRWVSKDEMTDQEKQEVQGWETMGGYLKELDYKEACRKWWKENPDEHERFLKIPGFDWEIFTEITGIEPESETCSHSGKYNYCPNCGVKL